MLFKFDGSDKGQDTIFHNQNLNLLDWSSKIPNPSLEDALLFDPALVTEFYDNNMFGNPNINSETGGISLIASLYLYNNITSTRISLGGLAQSVGILTSQFSDISSIFRERSDTIQMVFDGITYVLDSQYFKDGMNAICAIPIVGWIIKIIVKVAEIVYRIVKKIREKKIENAKEFLSSQYSIPLTEFNKDADELLTKIVMKFVQRGELDYLFSPRYSFDRIEDFYVLREKVNPSDQLTRFFNIRSENYEGNGIGFVPGTVNLFSAIRLPTSASGIGSIYNIGDLFPSVRTLCNNIYQSVAKPCPGLFSLSPDMLTKAWEKNIYWWYRYNDEVIRKAWSAFATGNIGTNTYYCSDQVFGRYGDACKAKNAGENFPTKGTGHLAAVLYHLKERFFEPNHAVPLITKTKGFGVENINLSESLPSKALKVLKETQYSVIDSIQCMYISDTIKSFTSLKTDKTLKNKWETNVADVLASKDYWKKVSWRDIADPEIKEIIKNKAIKENLKYDKNGPISNLATNNLSIEKVLGDPKPPSPFEPIDVKDLKIQSNKVNIPKSSENNLVLMTALAGAAYFLLKK